MKKSVSLLTKLSLSYLAVAMFLIACVSFFSNFFLTKQFEAYVMRQQEAENAELASQTAARYDEVSKSYSITGLETIGMDALERGMILRVTDASGAVVWDAMVHNNGLCHQMLQSMAERMESRYSGFQGQYEEKDYPLVSGTVNIGTASVGYYGPFYFSESDAMFIGTLNRALIGIGIGSLLFALVLGLIMARRVAKPVISAKRAAESIAQGHYDVRLHTVTGTKELDALGQAINKLSEELSRQETLRRQLTADVAHELRTPLTTLQGNMEAFMDGIWQPTSERLKSCHEETLRLNRLVGDLERLSRLEAGSDELRLSEFNLMELATHVLTVLEPAAAEKGVLLKAEGESVVLKADSDKLTQVLMNLMHNALRHTGAGGRITVRVSREQAHAILVVEDSGEGIPKEHLPHVFDRFYRVDPSRNAGSGGSGIGLAIVRAIVLMHGGTIGVESEKGRFTRFTVRLPLS